MYAAAFGRSPFDRGDVAATHEAVRQEEPALPGGPLGPVLRGLLAKNPALRVSAETARLMLLAAAAGVAAAEQAPAPARHRCGTDGTVGGGGAEYWH